MFSRRGFIKSGFLGGLISLFRIPQSHAKPTKVDLETGFTFLNHEQALTVDAIANRIWPPMGKTSIKEIGVVFYIDRVLSGFEHHLQDAYRRSIDALNDYSSKHYGARFADLRSEVQEKILSSMEQRAPELSDFFISPSASEFFEIALRHIKEGLFCDPIHGGNHGFSGWKSIGYTGPRVVYSADEQRSAKPLNIHPTSIRNF